jgi:predicted ArsR family transcriptional regulator
MTVSIPQRRYDALSELLAACGYEPARAADQLVLRTCPFQRLAGSAPELVCALA